MKKLIHSVLPALTLLTLGGCAGTSALSTTESDGVYFSSKDRVSAPVAAQTTSTQTDATNPGDVANPDYSDNGTSGATSSTEYYDDGFSYASRLRRFHQPTYRGLGMGYYDFAYTDPFWYGGPAYAIMPYGGFGYGYGAGFYDPFYSPYWGGTSISISFGRPFYRPFGYGYSYGYSPYDYYGYGYGGLGGGYYGGFGSGYYGNRGSGYYDRGSTRDRVSYGPRRDGAVEASRATGTATSSGPRGQVRQNGMLAPEGVDNSGVVNAPAPQPTRGRGRVQEVQPGSPAPAGSPGVLSSGNSTGSDRVGRQNAVDQAQPNLNPGSGRRWRVLEEAGTQPGAQPANTPADYSQPRRGRGWSNEGQAAQQQQSGSTGQPARRERAWQQPARTEQQSSSYEQPTRTYSEPSRSSSSPSNNGGNFGGGSSGGSRGRGRVN